MALQSLLSNLNKRSKCFRIVDSHVGEHLAVELNASLLKTVHENRIRKTIDASSSVDTGDPQTANFALLLRRSRYWYCSEC